MSKDASTSNAIELSGPVEYRDIPERITDPIPSLEPVARLKARLEHAGRVVLRDAEMVLGRADPSSYETFTLVADELVLERSQITTNGNHLSIHARRIHAHDSSIIQSFKEADRRAPPHLMRRHNGAMGLEGDEGGAVYLYVLEAIDGLLRIDLSGQHGGPGEAGAKGKTGRRGNGGRNARNGDFGTCRRGPGTGKRGGPGGAGGNGGDGGDGGDGGLLTVTYINARRPEELPIEFAAEAGRGGPGGDFGPGGDGGPGGLGGRNAGNCRPPINRERSSGPRGRRGPDGQPGSPGDDGAPGRLIVQELTVP